MFNDNLVLRHFPATVSTHHPQGNNGASGVDECACEMRRDGSLSPLGKAEGRPRHSGEGEGVICILESCSSFPFLLVTQLVETK